MKYLLIAFISLLFWLIHPLIGWITLFVLILFLYIYKKIHYYPLYIIIILLFSSFTYLSSYDNNKKEGTYTGIITTSQNNYFILSSSLINYYVYNKNNDFETGDIVSIDGIRKDLSFVTLESEFDFEKYLKDLNVKYELQIKGYKYHFKTPIRIKLLQKQVLKNFDCKYHEMISTLIFAEYSNTSNKLNELGIYSLITNSGIIIYSLIDFLKKLFNRFFNEKRAKLFTYLLCFPLIIFSDFKIGVLKAFFISLINDSNIKVNRDQIYMSLLILSTFKNPMFFKTSTFCYSFILPYLIQYLHDAIECISYKYKEIIKCLLINLLLIPFSIYFYYKINAFSFVFFYLFKTVFMVLFLCVYLVTLFPFLSTFLVIILNGYQLFINLLDMINIEFHYLSFSYYFIFIIILLISMVIVFLERNSKKKSKIVFFLTCSLLFFSSQEIVSLSNSYVSFLNVGQGDCILIHDKTTNVLIDTGGNLYKDIAKSVLIPYFTKHGINKIDHVFLSHDDYDHSGAFISLMENFVVKSYILGSDFFEYKVNNLKFYNLNTFGDGKYKNNDSSLLKLSFYSRTYLFCGDINSEIEQEVIKKYDVNADIIKISHHGSNTSSSLNFLKKVSPKEAVISVGKNNYNHPSPIILKRLKDLNISCRRTDQEGTITYKENNLKLMIYLYFFEVKSQIVYNEVGERK